MKPEISDAHPLPSSPSLPDNLRISNDRPVPHSAKSFAYRIEHGGYPVTDGSRLFFVKPAPARRLLRRLHVGDNIFLPYGDEEPVLLRARMFSAAKLLGIGVCSKTDEVAGALGLRLWRAH